MLLLQRARSGLLTNCAHVHTLTTDLLDSAFDVSDVTCADTSFLMIKVSTIRSTGHRPHLSSIAGQV